MIATAAAITYHCKGYQVGKAYHADYDKLQALGSGHPDWKLFLSLTEEVEDRYGLHKSPEGCRRALKDWGPQSHQPLVNRSR